MGRAWASRLEPRKLTCEWQIGSPANAQRLRFCLRRSCIFYRLRAHLKSSLTTLLAARSPENQSAFRPCEPICDDAAVPLPEVIDGRSSAHSVASIGESEAASAGAEPTVLLEEAAVTMACCLGDRDLERIVSIMTDKKVLCAPGLPRLIGRAFLNLRPKRRPDDERAPPSYPSDRPMRPARSRCMTWSTEGSRRARA